MDRQRILAILDLDRYAIRINRRLYWTFLVAVSVLQYAHVSVEVVAMVLWIVVCGARFHDIGRTAWWAVALVLLRVPFMSVFMPDVQLPDFPMKPGTEMDILPSARELLAVSPILLGGLVGLLGTVWLGFPRGNPEPNRFGPPISGWGVAGARTRPLVLLIYALAIVALVWSFVGDWEALKDRLPARAPGSV